MRRVFGKTIDRIAQKDKKVILIVGDIGYGIFDDFRKIIHLTSNVRPVLKQNQTDFAFPTYGRNWLG